MKKLFILLAACTIGMATSSNAMAAENSATINHNYKSTPTYEQTKELIDIFIAVMIFGSEDDAMNALDNASTAIESLEGLDKINAVAYLFMSLNDIISERGFSKERRVEIDSSVATYFHYLIIADDVDAEYEKFNKWCSTLTDDEEYYARYALSEYLGMII